MVLAVEPAAVDLCRARLHLDRGAPADALEAAERALDAEPDAPAPAQLLRAAALDALDRPAEAAAAYDEALAHAERVRPGDVLAAADCHRRGGGAASPPDRDDARTAEPTAAEPTAAEPTAAAPATASGGHLAALLCLERGLARLGPSVSLELAALDDEVALERWKPALARIDRLMAGEVRQESWLLRRGEVLEAARCPGEARKAYAAALEALELLPAAVLARPQTAALRRRGEEGLARCDAVCTDAPAAACGDAAGAGGASCCPALEPTSACPVTPACEDAP